jgi:CHAT domain-containing protein/Tfp pilus assembly protein PilF
MSQYNAIVKKIIKNALLYITVSLLLSVLGPLSSASAQDKPAEASLIESARTLGKEDEKKVGALQDAIEQSRRVGKFTEAVEPAGQVLAIYEKALGLENWQTADARRAIETLKHIARLPEEGRKAMASVGALDDQRSAMEEKARYAEAERLAREALTIRERWLGPDHTETAVAINKLAITLHGQDKDAEAEKLYRRVVDIRLKTLEPSHPLIGRGYNNLSANLYYQDRYAEAEAMARKALDIYVKVLGPDHPDTADGYNNLANNLDSLKKPAEAEVVYRKALAIYLRARGPDHLETAQAYNNLATTLDSLGKHAEAEVFLRKALAIFTKALTPGHPHIFLGTINLAKHLAMQDRYAEAEPLYRQALALLLESRRPDHPDIADCGDDLSVCLYAQGKYAEAEAACRKALAIFLKAAGPDDPDTVRCYDHLAAILSSEGKYAEAEVMHRKALAAHLKRLPPNHPNTGASYTNLGLNLNSQDRYAEAEAMHRKALAIFLKSRGPDHPDTAFGYTNLGSNLNFQGKYAEAESACRQAVIIFLKSRGPDHPDTAQGYSNLASNLNDQGKYAESEAITRKALAIRLKRLSPDHSLTARNYNDLSLSLKRQGKFVEAEAICRKALAIFLKAVGPEHPHTVALYGNLALLLNARGKHTEAETLARQALAIRLKAADPDNADTADSYGTLSTCLSAQGKHAEAEAMDRKALAINLKVRGPDHPITADDYDNLACSLDRQGKYIEAEPMHRKALVIRLKALGPDHPTTVLSHGNLGMCLDVQGRLDEAVEHWMSSAKSFETSRPAASAIALERFVTPGKDPRPFLAIALARLGRHRDAWQAWESDLARGLLDDLSARQLRPLTTDERQRETDLIGQLQACDEQIGRLVAESSPAQDDENRLDVLRQRQGTLRGQLIAMEHELSTHYREFAGTPATLDEIRSALPADAALVSWVDVDPGDSPGRNRSAYHWACVVRRDGDPQWVPTPGTGPDRAWTREDDRRPDMLRDALRNNTPAWRDLAEALAKQRLEPLRPQLKGVTHLIVLPSPALAGVPIDALLAAQPADAPRPTISYTPSGTMFARLAQPRPGPASLSRLLALGDPAFPLSVPETTPLPPPDHGIALMKVEPNGLADLSGLKAGDVLLQYNGTELKTESDLKIISADAGAKSILVQFWRSGEIRTATVASGELGVQYQSGLKAAAAVLAQHAAAEALEPLTRGAALERLPGTRREVEAIAALFPNDRVTTLLGEQATESAFQRLARNGDLKIYRYLHLATHGKTNPDVAMSSALFLAPDLDRSADPTALDTDGQITAQQIVNTWDLDADLVVLSACESGLGRYAGGEGYLGFTQALLVKGARSVVLSQWEVPDSATSLLMDRFYTNLLGKRAGLDKPMLKAESLREAKDWLRVLDVTQAEAEMKRLGLDTKSGSGRGEKKGIKSAGAVRPFEHPYYWAAFVLIGDPN